LRGRLGYSLVEDQGCQVQGWRFPSTLRVVIFSQLFDDSSLTKVGTAFIAKALLAALVVPPLATGIIIFFQLEARTGELGFVRVSRAVSVEQASAVRSSVHSSCERVLLRYFRWALRRLVRLF